MPSLFMLNTIDAHLSAPEKFFLDKAAHLVYKEHNIV